MWFVMKKIKQFGIIVMVVVVFVSAGIVAIVLGSRGSHMHYVCLEVNPRVEFITDKSHKVTSLKPLNAEAKELLIQEDFLGTNINDAVEKFLTLCAKSGYIKVNGNDNAVKLTVINGLNQGLEVELTKKINSFFVKNEILGVCVDASTDLQNFKDAKKYGVSSEKYDLMLAAKENDNSLNLKELKKYSNLKLVKTIAAQHKNYEFSYTETELNNKVKLIDFHRIEYEEHLKNITAFSTREFKEKLQKHIRENGKKYKLNWDATYNAWLVG